ncbi:MAG: hypothetical protein JW927_16710 [Deltaproteobacteria bacterium]|nr:hypothetical protein [Deltaproteobacteria bacterium]
MKIKTALFSLIICALFSFLMVSGSSSTEGNKRIVLAYSNNVEGYLEPCG